MTPEKRADELVEKFNGKTFALLTCDELIKYAWLSNPSGLLPEPYTYAQREYWEQVKEAILNKK